MSGYELSRIFIDFSFENPTIIKPNHYALYFFSIEHCNRLGWKEKFGLPTTMTMEAIGIRSYNTYIKTLNELVDYGFFELIERSKNQYSSNVIALSKNDKALDKALDKAFIKHDTKHIPKQSESTVQSTGESISSIDKQLTNKPETIDDEGLNEKKILEVYNKFVEEVKNGVHQQATEMIYMKLKIKKGSLTPLLSEFKGQLIIDQKLHKSTLELRKHFNNWLNKQESVGRLDAYKLKS